MTDIVFHAGVFLVGACIGSFLNVCIARWPLGLSVVRPRSRCPRCEHQIAWFENIPIASWLALRARCRGCRTPISPVYPLVELVVGLGWLAAVIQWGPTLTALRVAVFGTVLLGIMLTDAEHMEIPDGFTVFGFLTGLIGAAAATRTGELGPFADFMGALLGACAGAGAIAIVKWLGEVVLKREAMGFGDITLMAFVGAHLGTARSLVTIFLGALLGALLTVPLVTAAWWLNRRRGVSVESPEIPFGIFLAPAAFIALLWWTQLATLYIEYMTRIYG
ncbi:MAG: prepilin peptidase [Gemmatimonadota bacterium]|nr:prepilin peptidase [Gemmatimonadota bacterium]